MQIFINYNQFWLYYNKLVFFLSVWLLEKIGRISLFFIPLYLIMWSTGTVLLIDWEGYFEVSLLYNLPIVLFSIILVVFMIVYSELPVCFILVNTAFLVTAFVGNFTIALVIDCRGHIECIITIIFVFIFAFSMWFFAAYGYWILWNLIHGRLPDDYWEEHIRRAKIFQKEMALEEEELKIRKKNLQERKKIRKLAWQKYWDTFTILVKIKSLLKRWF